MQFHITYTSHYVTGHATVFNERTPHKVYSRKNNKLKRAEWIWCKKLSSSSETNCWKCDCVFSTASAIREIWKANLLLKSTIFWDMKPCSLLKLNQHFGGTYCLHLQEWISRERYQWESRWDSACHKLSCWCFARLIWPWRWRQYVPLKHQLTFNGLHGDISQKTILFLTTTVRTSNPKHTPICKSNMYRN
jgi:hypothetical protein